MVFFFTRHGGGVFLIFTWHGEGWQVANKTAALWEAGSRILRKANLMRQLSCFGEERNAWSDGNNNLNQGRLSASSCSNGKIVGKCYQEEV